jgi:hypothetical protein
VLERGSLHYLPSNPNGCRGIEARILQDRVLEDVMETKVFVGVDVSKDSLDVAIGPHKDIITFANDQNGVDALVKKLKRIDAQLTVFESTGGYELLACLLHETDEKNLFSAADLKSCVKKPLPRPVFNTKRRIDTSVTIYFRTDNRFPRF